LWEGALHPNSKSANILKAALQGHRISKALLLFRGSSVFDALHWRVCYFQTSVDNSGESILRSEGSNMLFLNDFGEDLLLQVLLSVSSSSLY